MNTPTYRPSGPGGGRPSHNPGQGYQRDRPAFDDQTPEQILTITDKITYFGSDGKLRPELLDADAQTAARALGSIPTTQLRRFYGQVIAIKRKLDIDSHKQVTDSEIVAQVAFLKASAAYASGRDKKNSALLHFVVRHANTIKTRADFTAFHRHFETVVAFHKVYGNPSNG